MIKNRFILCTIVLAYSLSIGAMNQDFFTIDKKTGKPLEVEIHGRKKRFKTTLMPAKDINPDSTVHNTKIVVLKHEGSEEVHYQIVTESPQVNPIEINKNFIDSMIRTTDDQNTDHIVLGASSATDPRHQTLCLLKITKESCMNVLGASPVLFTPIPKQEPQQQSKPVKKPKKVCDQEIDNPIKPTDLQKLKPTDLQELKPIDLPQPFQLPHQHVSRNEKQHSHEDPKTRQFIFFEEMGNNQFEHQNELAALYSKMQKENSDAIKNHFSQTAQFFAYRVSEINKLNDQKPNATELSEKEKAIKLLAHDMAHHYLSAIVNNNDLNVPSFTDYTELINSDMRKLEHKLFQHQEARDLSTTFREASNQSNLIVTEQQNHDAPFIKAIEKLKKQDPYRFPKAALKTSLSVGAEVAIPIAMSTAGEFAAAGILSFVDNPEQTKYESDLKKGIKEGEEYLEKNSIENIRQKHIKERLEETQKNRQQFDIHNVEALDRKELAQKIKDLYEQRN